MSVCDGEDESEVGEKRMREWTVNGVSVSVAEI